MSMFEQIHKTKSKYLETFHLQMRYYSN